MLTHFAHMHNSMLLERIACSIKADMHTLRCRVWRVQRQVALRHVASSHYFMDDNQ